VRPVSPPPKGPGPQAALALEPRELWIAAHVPQLSLRALQVQGQPAPQLIVDPEDRNQRVIDAAAHVQEAGVRVGMTLGAALAAVPHLEPRARELARERAFMQHLAMLAARFTPQVSLAPPDGVLLEIRPSITLFGGLRELCRKLRDACRVDPLLAGSGAELRFTLAPTALAALAAARAGARCFITDPAVLPARLKPLPLRVLRWPEEQNARLAAMGVRTLGELMRLPRTGFARRFGPALLADVDRLLGRRADPRPRVGRRERYAGHIDLEHEVEEHERILRALQPLLGELERFLRVRQRGITALQCRFHHYRVAPTNCLLRLAAPEASAARFETLLRERLATLVLPAPVRRCELRSGILAARTEASRSLWAAGEHGHAGTAEMPALVEHLRARLGVEAVYGIEHIAEHRPEKSWRVAEPSLETLSAESPGAKFPDPAAGIRRPLWLLASPQALESSRGRPRRDGALHLLSGPERIESGWWDAHDVQRDYYVAQDTRGARLWIYRECAGRRRWFLHGIFG
jgi:protein ImuB